MSKLSSLRHALEKQVYNPIKPFKLISLISPVTLVDSPVVELPLVADSTSSIGSAPVVPAPVAQASEAPADLSHEPASVPSAPQAVPFGPSNLTKSADITRYINHGLLPGEPNPIPMAEDHIPDSSA